MLTKKALLNGFQLLVDQLARILVNFFLTPIIVTNLGSAGFGVWQLIQKTSLQLASLDGRAPEVLKWVVASKQYQGEIENKRRAVGSALVNLMIFTPLLVIAFYLFVHYLPEIIEPDSVDYASAIKTIILLAVSAYILVIAMIFEAVIRGSNIAYRLVGVQALILIIGGVISAYLVSDGYGLVGLAYAQVFTSILFLISYYYVARRNISWLGVVRPSIADIRKTFNRCKWYTLWAFISMWMLAGDVIVLGVLCDADTVSRYVLTLFISQIATVAVLTSLASILPGMGGLLGNGESDRVQKLREESFLISWWLVLSIICTVIVFNHSFVSLWVGKDLYAGHLENILICLSVFQMVLIRHDANLLNLALDIQKKVVLGVASVVLTLLLMLVIVPTLEIVGLCISLIVGRLFLQILFPRILDDFVGIRPEVRIHYRMTAISCILITGSAYLSPYITVNSWLMITVYSVLFFLMVLLCFYAVAMSKVEKSVLLHRYNIVTNSL